MHIKMTENVHSGVEDVYPTVVVEPSMEINYATQSKMPYSCELCNVKVTSQKILQRHLEGKKHITRAERDGKTFQCDLCEIIANSHSQLEVHLRSSKHKARLARKERMELMLVSSSKGVWIIIFGMLCVFFNVLILFKAVL